MVSDTNCQPRSRINLDYSSHTPLLAEVKQVMAQAFEGSANPSSITQAGQRAKAALERARSQVAALIHAKSHEISFTSCGTESNNWALRGLMAANKSKGRHIIISAIEHPSVSLVAKRIAFEGADITILPVNQEGFVAPGDLKAVLKPETVLVSIMLANGEVGTVQPIHDLAAIAHEHGALFHTDAIAAVGHWPIDVKALGVDALSLAANQFYGPQGTAALYVRDGVRILPLLEGGGQETGSRSGTEAVPAIIGMGVAAEVAAQTLPKRIEHLSYLRDQLAQGLMERIEAIHINGPYDCRRVTRRRFRGVGGSTPGGGAHERNVAAAGPDESSYDASLRLPHNLHVCVDGVSSESLVLGLDQAGIAAGLGSACNAKAMRPSHVLKAMGLTDEQAKGALVLTVGESTTEEEIDCALEIIPNVVRQLRNVTALTAR